MQDQRVRQLTEIAISAGRNFQSPQTGFIQHCYRLTDENERHTIPLLENFLFALALLRSRDAESITEAKAILNKLLHFQNKEEGKFFGSFPTYLHEYPECKDYFFTVSILPIFYWILRHFSPVLGNELKQRLVLSTKNILKFVDTILKEKTAPFQVRVKYAASCKAFGELWEDVDLKKLGSEQLEEIRGETVLPDFGSWFAPTHIADTLVALQMAYSSIPNSPWKHFWEYVNQSWSEKALCYTGPKVKDIQWGTEPQANLYDLFLGYLSGNYPYRAFTSHPHQLHAAIIQAHPEKLTPINYPLQVEGKVADYSWCIKQTEDYSLSAIQKVPLEPSLDRGVHPLFISWGDPTCTHSFVCQGGNSSLIDYKLVPDGIDLIFSLFENVQVEDKEKSREITFFIDQLEGLEFKINDKSATSFQLNEKISLKKSKFQLHLTFLLEEGDGRFLGHIMPGNRLSQVNVKGENRFKAYDWEIALRTVRRKVPCRIRVEIRH
jgi:hypothetical protein